MQDEAFDVWRDYRILTQENPLLAKIRLNFNMNKAL